MKYLFLFSLFAFVAFLIFWRLRPYIHAVRRAMSVFRQMQTGAVGQSVGKKAEARSAVTGPTNQVRALRHLGAAGALARLSGSAAPAYCSSLSGKRGRHEYARRSVER
ncbi:MAG: hypothetical protein WKF30_06250 [Pyrinomonadaceae bacterium]